MLATLLALLASFSWGTSDFIAGVEARRTTSWAVALVTMTAAAAGGVVALAAAHPPSPSAGVAAILVAGGACSGLSAITYYYALRVTRMSITSGTMGFLSHCCSSELVLYTTPHILGR